MTGRVGTAYGVVADVARKLKIANRLLPISEVRIRLWLSVTVPSRSTCTETRRPRVASSRTLLSASSVTSGSDATARDRSASLELIPAST